MRQYKWDNLKVFMIIGIVFEHTLIIYNYPRSLELIWGVFIAWLMPMFTLISGFWSKERTVKEWVNRLIYPMLLFSAINLLVGYIFYDKYHGGFHVIGYAMWYLWALFIYSVATPWLLKHLGLYKTAIFSLSAILLYCMLPNLGTINVLLNELQINRIFGFYPFFLLGVWLRNHNQSHIKAKIVGYEWGGVIVYLSACYLFNGFAYKSGFYLIPNTGVKSILYLMASYVFISLICYLLVVITPNKEFWFTKYGSRTMNVYLLHMLVVFPISWGLFSSKEFTPLAIIVNSMLPVICCLVFFTDKVNNMMNSLLTKRRWSIVIILYCTSLLLVNKSWLF